MTNYVSAGVFVNEDDQSQIVEPASTSIGAVVGWSTKGPVGVRTLVTSVKQFLELFGYPDPAISYMHYAAIAFLSQSSQLYVTRVVESNALTAGAYLSVDDPSALSPVLSLNVFDAGDPSNTPMGVFNPMANLGFNPSQSGIANVLCFFCAANPGKWNNDLYVRIRPSIKPGFVTPNSDYEDVTDFYVDVFINYTSSSQTPLESFLVSRVYKTDGFGHQMYYEEVINQQSKLIRVKHNPYCTTTPIKVLSTVGVYLDGGSNGNRATNSSIINGWDLYADAERVACNILINAGYTDVAVQQAMDTIATKRKDAIAVLDVPYDQQELQDAIDFRRSTLNMDTSRSALYSPDLLIWDEYNDRQLYVPPSGHVAGAYAMTDKTAEAWFSPAGMVRGDLNVKGVRVKYNQGARNALTSAQVNAIRVIPGSGYKIWGDLTLQYKASATSNVNVRRLMNFVESSLAFAMRYSTFEPNDKILWDQLTEMSERFLKPIKGARGLYDFSVVCNSKTNTPETIAKGQTIINIYFDPVLPAKRIQLNAILTKTGANFFELATERAKQLAGSI
jgi:hypothetical protein